MRKTDPYEIIGWIYYTTPDAEGITWDEAAAQLAAYVGQQNIVTHKTHARRLRRLFTKYPSELRNHERLPLTISCPPGRLVLHIPVMPLSRFASKRGGKVSPGNARLVYVDGIYDAFDIIYHDSTKPKHKWATFYPYSMADKKPVVAPATNTSSTSSTSSASANRFARLASHPDNQL